MRRVARRVSRATRRYSGGYISEDDQGDQAWPPPLPSSSLREKMPSAMPNDVPSELTILSLLGRGSYGSVYAAQFRGRNAAVKAVPLEGSDGSEMCADLENEVRMLRECDSEYVVRYYGTLAKGSTLWIVMELCAGSVVDVLRRTAAPLQVDEIAVVVAAVVRGLAYLHVEKKVLHRDIKAGNVLLSTADGGGVKLCDFGVSASVGQHTKRATVIGNARSG